MFEGFFIELNSPHQVFASKQCQISVVLWWRHYELALLSCCTYGRSSQSVFLQQFCLKFKEKYGSLEKWDTDALNIKSINKTIVQEVVAWKG